VGKEFSIGNSVLEFMFFNVGQVRGGGALRRKGGRCSRLQGGRLCIFRCSSYRPQLQRKDALATFTMHRAFLIDKF